jgi:hypothetical protein
VQNFLTQQEIGNQLRAIFCRRHKGRETIVQRIHVGPVRKQGLYKSAIVVFSGPVKRRTVLVPYIIFDQGWT